MEISYQISWKRSHHYHNCSSTHVSNNFVANGERSISCQYGCSGHIISPISYVCTYFIAVDDWTFGEYNKTHNFYDALDGNIVTIGTTGGDWIRGVGQGKWNISTTFSLTKRNDTGRINSSPRVLPTPPLRLQQGCTYTIPLPVSDPDNDIVRCRWAVGDECKGVCNKFPGAILDTNTCIITYTANNGTGIKAVAIMVEDYATRSSHRPLSSVALQFLVLVYCSNQSCLSQIEWYRFPSITLHPSSKVLFWRQYRYLNLTLTCMANETSSYYWERKNGHIPSTASGMRTNTLILINVQPEDAGSYRCVAFVCSICARSFSSYAVIGIKGNNYCYDFFIFYLVLFSSKTSNCSTSIITIH